MSTALGHVVALPLAFDTASEATRTALKQQGFGVLTEIDLQATFKAKLDRDFRRFTILGACNPPLAFSAVSADPSVALLLPCNVTVEETDAGGSVVRLTDPRAMLAGASSGVSAAVAEVAADASARMDRVVADLRALGGTSSG
jgi:uncharacterized protein (DUF302 family)